MFLITAQLAIPPVALRQTFQYQLQTGTLRQCCSPMEGRCTVITIAGRVQG